MEVAVGDDHPLEADRSAVRDAAVERCVGRDAFVVEHPLEVVERLDQPRNDLESTAPARRRGLRGHAAAVVLEVGLGPLGKVQVLVALGPGLGDQVLDVVLDRFLA